MNLLTIKHFEILQKNRIFIIVNKTTHVFIYMHKYTRLNC